MQKKNPNINPDDRQVKIVTNDGKSQTKTYDKYDVQQWGDTLMKAEEIKADPGKMALLRDYLDGKEKAVSSIKDLKKLAAKKIARNEEYQQEGSSSDESDDDNEDGEEVTRFIA